MQGRILFLVFFLLGSFLRAQSEADSIQIEKQISELHIQLKREGKRMGDSLVVDTYLQLSDLEKSLRKYDQAIMYCDTVLKLYPNADFETTTRIKRKRAHLLKSIGKNDEMIASLMLILKEALKKNELEVAVNMHNEIGVIFQKMDEFKDAEYHLKESIRLARQIGNQQMIATSLMTLGNRFKSENMFDQAEAAYLESIKICKQEGYKRELAGNYNNYGSLMRMKGNLDEALRYYYLAVDINKEIKNDLWLSYNYNNIGNIFDNKKKYNEALKYYFLSRDIKEGLGDAAGQVQTMLNIAQTYGEIGNYTEAYKFQKRHLEMKDSLDKLDRIEQSKELAAQFQAERKEAEIKQLSIQDALNKQKLATSDQKLKYQNFLSWTFGIGGFMILMIAFTLWRAVRERKKTNLELEKKNQQIDEKNKEIIDSINYAKRIQNSILPGEKRRTELLGWHGLLYRPKDIVSGDFYICDETDNHIFFGTVDCTGHGVPGAMVSIVASSSFNKALHELGIREPEQILEQLNKDVPRVLDSNDEGVNDGMDMALVSLDKKRQQMKFAGAYQNCWVFNKKGEAGRVFDSHEVKVFERGDFVMYELKGIRRGIGMSESKEAFRSIDFKVIPGDKILLSTDGFQDQFGGQENKKFKIKQLRDIILTNADKHPDKIIEALNDALKGWQGTEEQIDDICVFVVEV